MMAVQTGGLLWGKYVCAIGNPGISFFTWGLIVSVIASACQICGVLRCSQKTHRLTLIGLTDVFCFKVSAVSWRYAKPQSPKASLWGKYNGGILPQGETGQVSITQRNRRGISFCNGISGLPVAGTVLAIVAFLDRKSLKNLGYSTGCPARRTVPHSPGPGSRQR